MRKHAPATFYQRPLDLMALTVSAAVTLLAIAGTITAVVAFTPSASAAETTSEIMVRHHAVAPNGRQFLSS